MISHKKKKRVDALEAPRVNFPLIEVADSGPGQAEVPEDDVVVQEADDVVRPILIAQRIAKLEAVDRTVLVFMDSDSDSDDHIDDNDESDDDYILFEHRENLYNVQSWILIVVRFESKA